MPPTSGTIAQLALGTLFATKALLFGDDPLYTTCDLMLLFWHSAKSSIAQEKCLATSPNWWHGSTCHMRYK